jgi:bifunctional DNA-binding transcriptional regulator/antitoxin component of YhaV-PrlF toxin-antitoxin module
MAWSEQMAERKGSGFSEEKATYGGAKEHGGRSRAVPERRILKIGPGGRLVIPADFRKSMEVEEGDTVVALLQDGELRLVGGKVGIRKAQQFFRSLVPEDVSLVDELIADRIREAEEEERDD